MREGIPTLYRHVWYRSRLEARWAAFFDRLGWGYQYEPFDLEGWIPDFLLPAGGVLVEVKPVVVDFVANPFAKPPSDVAAKIDSALVEPYSALIVGCNLSVNTPQDIGLGWCCESLTEFWEQAWFYGAPAQIGFSGRSGGWGDWLGHYRGLFKGADGWGHDIEDWVCRAWARAGNDVQYRPSRWEATGPPTGLMGQSPPS
jgi:hypothetical protein